MFPIVWPILYADIAAVSASTVDQLETSAPTRPGLHAALAINLLLNGSWTWLFFNRRKLGASAVAAAALTAKQCRPDRRAVEARSNRGAPLALYPLWCAFATLLSTRIWMLNR